MKLTNLFTMNKEINGRKNAPEYLKKKKREKKPRKLKIKKKKN